MREILASMRVELMCVPEHGLRTASEGVPYKRKREAGAGRLGAEVGGEGAAAVEDEGLAGEEFGGDEEEDGVGDFVGAAGAAGGERGG